MNPRSERVHQVNADEMEPVNAIGPPQPGLPIDILRWQHRRFTDWYNSRDRARPPKSMPNKSVNLTRSRWWLKVLAC